MTTTVVILYPHLAAPPADAYLVFSGLDSALAAIQEAGRLLDGTLARLERAEHPDADRVRRIRGNSLALAAHLAPLVLDWGQRLDAEAQR